MGIIRADLTNTHYKSFAFLTMLRTHLRENLPATRCCFHCVEASNMTLSPRINIIEFDLGDYIVIIAVKGHPIQPVKPALAVVEIFENYIAAASNVVVGNPVTTLGAFRCVEIWSGIVAM